MPFKSLGVVSYSPSVVVVAVSVAVCEIVSVKEWCDPENRVRVLSSSSGTIWYITYEFLLAFHSKNGALASLARFSELLVENRKIFISNLYLAATLEVNPSEFCEYV